MPAQYDSEGLSFGAECDALSRILTMAGYICLTATPFPS
jgi:hypothetical protein